HTLSPTALVHEAFCRLRPHLETLESRRQFFAAARQVMRRILIDYARRRNSQKRSPRLFEPERPHFPDTLELWHMDMVDALAELERLDPERHAIVEYRFFFGLTMEEIAGLLSVSKSKVEKDWRVARAWLYQRLRSES
ncbi:MAG: sigma-70 family RNA polymerase sigma factor, partial [Candidatus Eisenbacteria bacterium]|nr:sigma-70 family RNA polymerase sigma factor [Candidatus Eisenbacteria bacterium]